jgi:hypothetical protein
MHADYPKREVDNQSVHRVITAAINPSAAVPRPLDPLPLGA